MKITKKQLMQIIKEEIELVLTNEEVEEFFGVNVGELLKEKELTEPEKKEKERLVKGMKDKEEDFEERYPGQGKNVMYATATKMAKKRA